MDALIGLTLRISPALHERVRWAAYRQHLSMSKLIEKILDETLPETGQEPAPSREE